MARLPWTWLLLLPLLAAGCAEPVKSGFLAPYSGFQQVSPVSTDLEYVNPNASWKQYHKVRIFPVAVYGAHSGRVNPAEAARLADFFGQQLVKAFGENYKVVSEPGSDVLDVRAAITNLNPTDVAQNAAVQTGSFFLPFAWNAGIEGYKGLTGDQLGMGEAQVEAEFRDSLTQQRQYGYVARKIGSSLDVVGQTSAWGVVETSLTKWASFLHRELKYRQDPTNFNKIMTQMP